MSGRPPEPENSTPERPERPEPHASATQSQKGEKAWIAIGVAVLSGLFGLTTALMNRNSSGPSALEAKSGEGIAERTLAFYDEVSDQLFEVTNLFAEYCKFEANFDRHKELNDWLSLLFKTVQTAPAGVPESITASLEAYSDLVAGGLVGEAQRTASCLAAPTLRNELAAAIDDAQIELVKRGVSRTR